MEIKQHQKNEQFEVYFRAAAAGEEWRNALQASSELLQKYHPLEDYPEKDAPLEVMIERKGAELLDRASHKFLTDSVSELLGRFDYAPVSLPKMEVLEADFDHIEFEFSFTDFPAVDTMDLDHIVIEKPVVPVSEEEINATITALLKEHADIKPVNRPAQFGDTLEIEFSGIMEGRQIDNGKTRKETLVLGSNSVFPGMDAALVGLRAGDTATKVRLYVPKSDTRHSIAGKKLQLMIKLLSVSETVLPELTDEFVAANVEGASTVAEYKVSILAELQAEHRAASDEFMDDLITDAMGAALPIAPPEAMVDTIVQKYRNAVMNEIANRNTSLEMLLKTCDIDIDTMNAEYRKIAERQVKKAITIDYITRKLPPQVTREDYEAYLAERAAANNTTREEIIKRAGDENNLIEDLVARKCVEVFLSKASVVEVPVDALPVPVKVPLM